MHTLRIRQYWAIRASYDCSFCSHDTEREHACQRDTLAQRHLDVEQILGWPQENKKIAECVLCRVEVVDSLDIQALCPANVLEDVPVGIHRSVHEISKGLGASEQVDLRALE